MSAILLWPHLQAINECIITAYTNYKPSIVRSWRCYAHVLLSCCVNPGKRCMKWIRDCVFSVNPILSAFFTCVSRPRRANEDSGYTCSWHNAVLHLLPAHIQNTRMDSEGASCLVAPSYTQWPNMRTRHCYGFGKPQPSALFLAF